MNTTRQSVSCSVALVWASRKSAANWSAAASTLQQGEQHDDPDGKNDAHDGYGGQDLWQGVTPLVLTTMGHVRPYRTHDVFVGAATSVL